MEALYVEAGKVIKQAILKTGSIKGLCFKSNYENKKKLYALVCQTIKYKNIISRLLEKIDQDDIMLELDVDLQLVLAYDILFGKGIRCGGKIGLFSKNHKKTLFELLEELQKSNDDLADTKNDFISLPRYVRVNTLKITVDEVVKTLENEGWNFIENKEGNLNENEFTVDAQVPDVLTFCPGTDFHEHPLYLNGQILLQDKASCLPAFLLKPKPSSTMIDACAAPGNKTTHLSAIMQNQGKIFAFDMDSKRLKLLKDQLKKAGTRNVEAMHQDFLKVNVNDERFRNVKYILLDPSCSGSGMVSRMDQLLDDGKENTAKLRTRLEALSKFQYAMLCHALSFPKVQKVAYSTCSIHEQENETVVERALKRFSKKFELVKLLPSWEHRGLSTFEFGSCCLRASPEIDKTNGFFVTVFKRIKSIIKSVEGGIILDEDDQQEKIAFEQVNDTNGKTKGKKSRKRKASKERNMEKQLPTKQHTVKNKIEKKAEKRKQERTKRRRKTMKKPVTGI